MTGIEMTYVATTNQGGPAVGATLRTRKGECVTVVRTTARFIGQDEVDDQDDFANDGKPYWAITAHCRPATDEEAAPLVAEAQAAKARKAAKTRVGEIARQIMFTGERPAACDTNAQGERLFDTQDAHGGGNWFVVAGDGIWYVQNNGRDGDNWEANNVLTGGAGAIGWRIPLDDKLAAELRQAV